MTAIDTILAALAERDCRPRGSYERGYTALCAAHDDRTPSLSITERDGKVLLYCHGGCETEAVLDSLALDWSDLFDEDPA